MLPQHDENVAARDVAMIDRADPQCLLDELADRGYQVVGPTARDGAICYDRISDVADLPIGWIDEQEGGHYRLRRSGNEAVFGFTVGPQSWKPYLHPPVQHLWQAHRDGGGFVVEPKPHDQPPLAFFGVRSCELHAIAIQDRVFMGGPSVDPAYAARRRDAFIVAVNCTRASATCFCVSMQTGPRAEAGFELALTEVLGEDRHFFVVEVGNERGAAVLAKVPHRSARDDERSLAARIVEQTSQQMGRQVDTDGLRELLRDNAEHPNWQVVADRCLSCGNCTMVCPTCFCTSVEDVTDLTGQQAERRRTWDSCFTSDFSYVVGGSVRRTPMSRYRQWMTHKFSTWIDQFGTSGCVGCGRCITWCPVGIDVTAEIRAIRQGSRGGTEEGEPGDVHA